MLRKYFWQNYLFHSSKEVFFHNFTQFLENWIFEGISTGADLTKMVKIWTIWNWAKKLSFVKIICSTHQRKCSSTILGNFGKIEFLKEYSTGADLTKMVKICIILICAKKILFGKIFCSIHQRKCFSTILRNFWKIEFWRNIDRRTPYKMLKIWTISICAKKIFFGKIICSTHQRKCFSTILRNFWKIEFLKEYRQARSLIKMVKIWTILNCAKKNIFCQNYLFHSSKEVFLHNFMQFLENWIFEGISTGADLTKLVKICIILICAKKIFFGKINYVPLIKRSVSPQFYAIFRKMNFWRNIDRRRP